MARAARAGLLSSSCMDWTSLGHAGWLIEAAGLRLVCDPLVEVDHHGGVFEVRPRRRLRAAALRADFILISHRHPDHFDVRSLAQLAALDPDSVVITPDELVGRFVFDLVAPYSRPPGRSAFAASAWSRRASSSSSSACAS